MAESLPPPEPEIEARVRKIVLRADKKGTESPAKKKKEIKNYSASSDGRKGRVEHRWPQVAAVVTAVTKKAAQGTASHLALLNLVSTKHLDSSSKLQAAPSSSGKITTKGPWLCKSLPTQPCQGSVILWVPSNPTFPWLHDSTALCRNATMLHHNEKLLHQDAPIPH